jgi:hypothetical protein
VNFYQEAGMRFKLAFAILIFFFAWPFRGLCADIITVDEIRPGMKGYGKTVFEGTEAERFDVEVIDVLHKVMPDRDVILVRCSGHGLENTRVVAGMSGSPIYLEGRLAGAVAFTWSFSKEPLAGVTPIQNMLQDSINPSFLGASAPGESSERGLTPIATPLIISGGDPGLMDDLEESLRAYNLVPVPGGSSSGHPDPIELEPGSAIGAQLVSGDMQMTAVGTVSYLEGTTVIAFGHSFLNGGRLSAPITSAKIHTIVDSHYLSFKVASPVQTVGALEQDRLTGIYGRLGAKAEMVPYEINVNNKALGQQRKYHFDIVSHQFITLNLLQYILSQVVGHASPASTPSTVNLRTEFQLENHAPITFEDSYYTISYNYNLRWLEPLYLLLMNPFEYAPLKKVNMDMTVSPELNVATINSAWVKNGEVHAGEEAEVHVLLKPYNLPEIEEVISIPVPENSKGTLIIKIAGGSSLPPDVAPPKSVDDLIQALKKVLPSKSMVAVYPVQGQALDYQGMRLHKLPPSMAATLNPATSNLARPRRELLYQVKDMPYIVIGNTRLSLRVLPPRSR